MDHEEFISRTKDALQDQSAGRPEEAVVKLRAIPQDLEPAMKAAVNDWQSGELSATRHEEDGAKMVAGRVDTKPAEAIP